LFSTPEVIGIAQSIATDFGGSASESPNAVIVEIRRSPKKIHVEWPKQDLTEIWMTFYEGNDDIGIYQNWFECMEQEDKAEFVEYARTLISRFFAHATRVRKRGWTFRRSILEIQTEKGWTDIFEPQLDL
jgi:hypothetical protein